MASLRPRLHNRYRLLLCIKNSSCFIGWCLIFFLAFQPATLAETTVYLNNSTYTVFDDNVSGKPVCFTAFSQTKKVTFYNVNNKNDCLNSTAILSSTLPKFSDRLADQTYPSKNTFFEAVVLLCWSDIASFLFYCLVLFLFAQVLPG